jgi:hypothetical protein
MVKHGSSFCGDVGHTSDTEKLPKDYNIRLPQCGNQRKQKNF